MACMALPTDSGTVGKATSRDKARGDNAVGAFTHIVCVVMAMLNSSSSAGFFLPQISEHSLNA